MIDLNTPVKTQFTIDELFEEELARIGCFKIWYKAMAELNPKEFPLEIPFDDVGTFYEGLDDYSSDDSVYKL